MADKATEANLASALAAFQAELPSVGKDAKATIPPKDGKSGYSYKYAGLGTVSEAILPLLGKHGLSFSSKPTISDGRFVLAFSLRHSSGEHDDGEYPLPDPTKVSAQAIGSAVTYARRYCLLAVTGVAPDEDDDGATAAPASRERVQREWEQAAPAVDPAEDLELREQYERDIAAASSPEEITKIGQSVKRQIGKEVSQRTYDYLDRKAAERLAELKGAEHVEG